MMTTKGRFKVLEKEKYTALALPLDPTYIDVTFTCLSKISTYL